MSDAPTAKQVRLYCDGELTLPEAAAVEAQLREQPDAAALAGFERDLKAKVAAAMSDDAAPPAGLKDRVRAAIAAETADETVGRIGTSSETPDPHRAPHRAWWKAPLRANAFAVAASLLLVAGAVLFGIFGQPIDAWRGPPVIDIGTQAAAAAADEHARSATSRDGPAQRARYRTLDEANSGLAPYFGDVGCAYDLSDMGYTFVGGDTCELPGCDRGCHLLYKTAKGEPALISLHVIPRIFKGEREGNSGLDDLPLPTDMIPRSPNCRMDVLVWSHGDRCYLLSLCIPRDAEKIAKRMQEQLLAGGSP